MSRSINRRRIANKYRGDLAIFGDDASADNAQLISNVLAEASRGVGGLISERQKAAAAAKKSAADKAAYDAAHVDEKAAVDQATKLRKEATFAAADARAAKLKADAGEQDPNGPLHIAARKAAEKAAMADADARAAEEKVAYYQPAPTATPGGAPAGHALHAGGAKILGLPWWGFALGVGVVGIGGFMLLRGRKG